MSPCKEGGPLPGHSTSLYALQIWTILRELPAIGHISLPGDVGWVSVLETDGPLLWRAWQGAHPEPLALDDHRVAASTPIDIGSGIGRVMQNGMTRLRPSGPQWSAPLVPGIHRRRGKGIWCWAK
jgi:hypothetical protein